MENALDDAKRVSECLSLKLRLSSLSDAMRKLIGSLHDRAFEAKHETHPSPDSGLYFRNLFENSIHQFWYSIQLPLESDTTSYRRKAYNLMASFSVGLIDLLPRPCRSLVLDDRTIPSKTYDWHMQLELAAASADQLAQELQILHGLLEAELAKKARLYKTMGNLSTHLSKVL